MTASAPPVPPAAAAHAHAPLVIDVAGTALTADDRRRLAHPLVGGMILFGRNWQDRAQLRALTAEVKALRPDLLVCVDHEGGRVQRFRTDGFTHLPPMRALGELWMRDAAPGADPALPTDSALRAVDAADAAGYVLGAELRACGVDFSFAPVLDLDHGPSGVIGDRAFHRDPRIVALLARGLVQGLLRAGMAHCGKHFPGHGFAAADSHTDAPVDERGLDEILADDAAPYAWLGAGLASVMPAHVVYPRVDARPAGFSRTWLREILRGRLGFDGAVFSDDLSMEGARRLDGRALDYADAALAALAAGCDLALLCNQSVEAAGGGRALDALIDGFERARADGRWVPDPASERRRRALLPAAPAPDWDALLARPAYRAALGRLV
ncbi:MAG: beta-N-acetylhexosaminidase [Xylophilus ampelinus]